MEQTDSSCSYVLDLGDGLAWLLTAAPDAEEWLRQMAQIMRLKRGVADGMTCWRFERRPEAPLETLRKRLDYAGASLRRYRGVTPWNRPDLKRLEVLQTDSGDETVVQLSRHCGEATEFIMMRHAVDLVFQRAVQCGGIPIHTALAEFESKGVLIAGRSGVGKSTASGRLPAPWKSLSDDQALILPDRSGRPGYNAHPFPTWSDYLTDRSRKTWDIAHKTPLKAIFFLEQGEADEVKPLANGEAAARLTASALQVGLHGQTTSNDEEKRLLRRAIFNNVCDVAAGTPAYVLSATLRGRFWEKMETVIK